MSKKEDPLKDLIVSSGGNKYLDPVKINGLRGDDDYGRIDDAERKDRSAREKAAQQTLSLGTKLKEDMGKSNASKYKAFFGDKLKGGDDLIEPTIHRIRTRDVRGDGPKSTLRPSKKMSSAFGRGVPYAGGLPNLFKTPHWQSIIGKSSHFIPNQGLFDAGISMGPKTIQGVNFDGAFPQINTQFWNGSNLPAATYQDQEDNG